MLHRRTLNDDSLGIGEPLNESAFDQGLVVRGRHFLIVEQPASSARLHRVNAQCLYMHPLATFGLTQQTYADYSAAFRQTWSGLNDALPLNVHLLTFDQLDAKNYLIRIEHYFELNEDANYSQPVTFDLQSIFRTIGTISNIVELTLSANLPLANLQRLNWTTTDGESSELYIPSNGIKYRKYFLNKNIMLFYRTKIVKRYKCHFESNANPNVPSDSGTINKIEIKRNIDLTLVLFGLDDTFFIY